MVKVTHRSLFFLAPPESRYSSSMPRTEPSPLLVRTTRSFKQRRAAATYEALLRAAAKVFAEQGYEGAQTPDIAAAAGVSTGAFYRYFTDKKQVFLEVLLEHLTRGRAGIEERLLPERLVGNDSRTAFDVVIDVLFEVVRRDAALHRVFLAASMSDPDVAELRAAFEAEDRVRLAELMGSLVPRDVVPDPEAAAFVIQASALEVAMSWAGLRPKRGKRLDEREVKRALVDMLHRYLFPVRGPAARVAKKRSKR